MCNACAVNNNQLRQFTQREILAVVAAKIVRHGLIKTFADLQMTEPQTRNDLYKHIETSGNAAPSGQPVAAPPAAPPATSDVSDENPRKKRKITCFTQLKR